MSSFNILTRLPLANNGQRYVDSQTASMMNLTYASDSTAVIKVDTDTQNQTSGRKSVRITSTNSYDNGLFIFDVVHTPYGCATWPALWLTDPSNWPEHGEIDVMESNNKGTHGNDMTLHTTSGCKMNAKRKETGTALYSNCLNTANDNAGCGVKGKTATYGEAFNDNGGGVSPSRSESDSQSYTDLSITRCTPWSFAMLGSEFGCFREMIFPRISQTQPVARIPQRGERPWQTFPAPTVTSAHISRIKVSSQILIYVVTLLVQLHITRTSTAVQTHALSSQLRTERTLRTHTGSSIVSRYISRHRTSAFHKITIIYSMVTLLEKTLLSVFQPLPQGFNGNIRWVTKGWIYNLL